MKIKVGIAKALSFVFESGLELLTLNSSINAPNYSAVVLAVAHDQFLHLDLTGRAKNSVLFDIKAMLPRDLVDMRL